MDKLCLTMRDAGILFVNKEIERLIESFSSSFARRYIPDYIIGGSNCSSWIGARVYWKWIENGFKVVSAKYNNNNIPDEYIVLSSLPRAYVNEAPFFFTLQAFARALARKGTIIFTDTVSFLLPNNKAVLLLGYQHSGKSTLTAIAASQGLIPLSTENTLIDANTLRIVGGTSILVYDPEIKKLYNIDLPVHEKTRHGYHVVDLNKLYSSRIDLLRKGVEIQSIYILHCSFRSTGSDKKKIKGRKIRKTLWYFATSLIKGMDYYEPSPLDIPFKGETAENIYRILTGFHEHYENNIYEIFGRHDSVFKQIISENK